MSSDQVKFHLQLDFTLNANGEDHEYVAQRVHSSIYNAVHAAITGNGDTAAKLEEHKFELKVISPGAASLDEDQLTRWMSSRIDSGALRTRDLPRLLARYALADPGLMRLEFADSLGLDEEQEPTMYAPMN